MPVALQQNNIAMEHDSLIDELPNYLLNSDFQ
jgi:hypothetical protein